LDVEYEENRILLNVGKFKPNDPVTQPTTFEYYTCTLTKVLEDKIYIAFINVILSSIILPVILYGCETWSLTLREERRLRVFENRMLRRLFGPKKDEVTGEWRKLPSGYRLYML
jgi:hypothetical protein